MSAGSQVSPWRSATVGVALNRPIWRTSGTLRKMWIWRIFWRNMSWVPLTFTTPKAATSAFSAWLLVDHGLALLEGGELGVGEADGLAEEGTGGGLGLGPIISAGRAASSTAPTAWKAPANRSAKRHDRDLFFEGPDELRARAGRF